MQHMALTDDQRALQRELRDYFERMLTADVRRELGGEGDNPELFRELVRQIGKDGWLGLGWPKEYGGGGASAYEQLILFTEVQRAGAPFPFVTVNTVGPTIMAFGTQEQKDRFLPGILAGEDVWAIGYTEPQAGTDLASLRTRAVRDGDEWVIDGNKVYTSGAGHSDYVWLACRTNPDVPKHQGISIIVCPTSAAGFTWTPLHTVGGNTTTTLADSQNGGNTDNSVHDSNNGGNTTTTLADSQNSTTNTTNNSTSNSSDQAANGGHSAANNGSLAVGDVTVADTGNTSDSSTNDSNNGGNTTTTLADSQNSATTTNTDNSTNGSYNGGNTALANSQNSSSTDNSAAHSAIAAGGCFCTSCGISQYPVCTLHICFLTRLNTISSLWRA